MRTRRDGKKTKFADITYGSPQIGNTMPVCLGGSNFPNNMFAGYEFADWTEGCFLNEVYIINLK